MTNSIHNALIVEQFTQQAIPFTNKREHSNEDEFELLYHITPASSQDTVLDIACGSGLVGCAFAKVAKHVVGIDITLAMIERAILLQQQQQLQNLTWQIGDVLPLPYADASFSLIITRYSFHHFLNPQAVLSEMCRVCILGGRVAVIDVTPEPDKAIAYNNMEKLRDPSHTKALPLTELQKIMQQAGLVNLKTSSYSVEMELEKQLQASFPNPGDADRIRQLFLEDMTENRLGVSSYRLGEAIYFAYPVSVVVGELNDTRRI